MKFPNAHNGVKKTFTAEILSLIGTVALAIAAVLILATGAMVDNGAADAAVNETLGMTAGFALFGLVGGILMLVAFIMNLAGIISAQKDEGSFKTALTFVIVGIAASALSSIFSKNDLVSDFAQIISEGLALLASVLSLVVYFIYLGFLSKAKKMLAP